MIDSESPMLTVPEGGATTPTGTKLDGGIQSSSGVEGEDALASLRKELGLQLSSHDQVSFLYFCIL